MSTRSIYHKTCPSCAAQIALGASQCECGYAFDAARDDAATPSDETTAQERELMREYLNARIDQAVGELTRLQTTLAADPKNLQSADRLMRAYVALHELRREFDAHSPRAADRPGAANDAPITSNGAAATDPARAFRLAQARKAEQIMSAAGMRTKECPHCHAVVPERAVLCFCGQSFAAETERASADVAPLDEQRTVP
jgi:hypothetical protein